MNERQRLDPWIVLAAVSICCVTSVVIAGWLFSAPVLQSFVPGSIGMKLVTATTFLIAVTAMMLQLTRSVASYRLSLLLAVVVAAFGCLSIAQDLSGTDFSIDRMWVTEMPGTVETVHPGRMAFNTAVGFAAIGVSLLLSRRKSRTPSVIARFLLLIAGIIAVQVLIGYVFRAPQVRSSSAATPMALPTAINFALLAFAGARMRRDEWPMNIIVDESASGAAARTLLPAAVLITVGFGWFFLFGEERDWYGPATSAALYAIAMVLSLSGMTLFAASRLHRIELARRSDREDLGRAVVAQELISTASREVKAVERAIVEQSRSLVGAAGAALVVLEQGNIVYRTATGSAEALEGIRTAASRSYIGVALLQNRPSLIDDLSRNEAMDIRVRQQMGNISVAILPLRSSQVILGAIMVFGGPERAISAEQVDLLRVIANASAAALIQAEQFERGQFMLLEQAGELAVLQEQFSAFMKNIPAAAYIKDEAGRYQYVNKMGGEFLGADVENILGLVDEDFLPPGRVKSLHDLEAAMTASGRAGAGHVIRLDASQYASSWLLFHFPISIGSGRKFLGGVAIDITEQKRAEQEIVELNTTLEARVAARTEQLERINTELEAFTYSVSHDLRSPLRAVTGYSRILEEDYAPKLDDEARRFLKTIRSEAQRMATLIDDLLAFSRIGRQGMAPSALDLTQLVREVFAEVERERPDRSMELICEKLPLALADRSLMRQVLINLLSNAAKYAKKEGTILIEVGATADDEFNTYRVRDYGVGFDMRYSDKLFGVFQRLHSSQEFEGTGVGLAIVERIVTRHSGRVWAEARVGEGATFYFTLPTPNSRVFDEVNSLPDGPTIPRADELQEKA